VFKEIEMIDFLVGALSTPGAAWAGIIIGIVAALLAWTFLPESIDRASIGGWCIALGFIGGLACSTVSDQKKKDEHL
jgi:hypothetical protein